MIDKQKLSDRNGWKTTAMRLPSETYYDEYVIHKVACAVLLAYVGTGYAGNLDDDAPAWYPAARAALDCMIVAGELPVLVIEGPPHDAHVPHQRRLRVVR